MKKFKFLMIFAALFMFLSSPAMAGEVRMAYANLQKALNDCEAGQKAKETLQQEAQKLEEELNSQQEELKRLKEEIEKKGSVWNAETRQARERDFQAKSQSFQKRFMEYGEELNKKKQRTEARIIGELREVVEELAKKKNYTYVFEKSMGGLLHAPEDADITDEVIKLYDKKFRERGEQ